MYVLVYHLITNIELFCSKGNNGLVAIIFSARIVLQNIGRLLPRTHAQYRGALEEPKRADKAHFSRLKLNLVNHVPKVYKADYYSQQEQCMIKEQAGNR